MTEKTNESATQSVGEALFLRIRDVDGELIVDRPSTEGAGWVELVRYRRTRPADESKTEAWSEELVTDVGGVARAAVTKMTRAGELKVRL